MDKQTEKKVNVVEKTRRNSEKVLEFLTSLKGTDAQLGVKKTAQLLIESTPKHLWELSELTKYFSGRTQVTVDMQLRKLIKDKKGEIAKIKMGENVYYGCTSVCKKLQEQIDQVIKEAVEGNPLAVKKYQQGVIKTMKGETE